MCGLQSFSRNLAQLLLRCQKVSFKKTVVMPTDSLVNLSNYCVFYVQDCRLYFCLKFNKFIFSSLNFLQNVIFILPNYYNLLLIGCLWNVSRRVAAKCMINTMLMHINELFMFMQKCFCASKKVYIIFNVHLFIFKLHFPLCTIIITKILLLQSFSNVIAIVLLQTKLNSSRCRCRCKVLAFRT